jgi:hypothetical protein
VMLTSVLGVAGDVIGDDVNALVSIGSVLISIGNIPVIDYCTIWYTFKHWIS